MYSPPSTDSISSLIETIVFITWTRNHLENPSPYTGKRMMKYLFILLFACSAIVVAFNLQNDPVVETIPAVTASITTAASEDNTAFDTMMKVLMHKRCVNCHPSDAYPRQGEDSHIHRFGIERGKANHGAEATTCNTCHQADNNNQSGVPGAPEWSLAPLSMAWQGLSRTEIARSMLDRKRNGNRSIKEIEHHLTEHELVLWAWEPGVDNEGNPREKPPVSKEDYIAAVKKWVEEGAHIPDE